MDLTNGIKKACPICDREHRAYEADVLPSGAILYRFKCNHCGWPYQKRVNPPDISVEELKGFRSKRP